MRGRGGGKVGQKEKEINADEVGEGEKKMGDEQLIQVGLLPPPPNSETRACRLFWRRKSTKGWKPSDMRLETQSGLVPLYPLSK